MKRSEMFKLMMESYCKEVPYNNDGGIQLQWKLDRMLTDMEKAGMLPPHILDKSVEEDLNEFEEKFFSEDVTEIECHVWEPEDNE